jgi:hypothetical protein
VPKYFAYPIFLNILHLLEVVGEGMTERVEVLSLLALPDANILSVGAIKPL